MYHLERQIYMMTEHFKHVRAASTSMETLLRAFELMFAAKSNISLSDRFFVQNRLISRLFPAESQRLLETGRHVAKRREKKTEIVVGFIGIKRTLNVSKKLLSHFNKEKATTSESSLDLDSR